jgi:putative SOS response-associated peptidase YedK
MCGRYSLNTFDDDLPTEFDLIQTATNWSPRYNIARPHDAPFAFAGLWDLWLDPDSPTPTSPTPTASNPS